MRYYPRPRRENVTVIKRLTLPATFPAEYIGTHVSESLSRRSPWLRERGFASPHRLAKASPPCGMKDLTAKVTVPRWTAELRMTGLEDSVTREEVVAAVAEAGGCRADKVNVGAIRSALRSLESVWLRCPLTVVRKISGRGDVRPGGKINIGWTAARVSPFPARQLQCFRCMESGHVRRDCTSTVRPVG